MPEPGDLPAPRVPFRYYGVKATVRTVLWLYGGYRVTGAEHVPGRGGALVCPNHISYMDPPAVGGLIPRFSYFMAKKELFTVPVLGWLIGWLFAFPVDREGADRTAVRTAIETLQRGNLLTIFPEGGRSPDGSLQPASPGPALIASRAGVPMVPASVMGTDTLLPRGSKWLHRSRVYLDFGEPVHPADFGEGRLDKGQLAALTEEVMQRVEALQKRQYERVGLSAPPRVKERQNAK